MATCFRIIPDTESWNADVCNIHVELAQPSVLQSWQKTGSSGPDMHTKLWVQFPPAPRSQKIQPGIICFHHLGKHYCILHLRRDSNHTSHPQHRQHRYHRSLIWKCICLNAHPRNAASWPQTVPMHFPHPRKVFCCLNYIYSIAKHALPNLKA